MKKLTMNEALNLSLASTSPSISIYLDIAKDQRSEPQSIHRNLDRLIRNAEVLVERSFSQITSGTLISSLKTALQQFSMPQDASGLAIYHKDGFTGYLKMPSQIHNLAIAAKSFHLKPVLRCAQLHRAYYMAIFRKNISELWLVHPERTQRILLVKSSDKPESNQGYLGIQSKTQMDRYCHKFARLYRTTPLPVLLAGPLVYQETFKQSAKKKNFDFLPQSLTGSIDHLEIKSLAQLAQPIISSHFQNQDCSKVEDFHRAESAGLASTDIHEIARWAVKGQVSTLLVAEDRHIWGELNRGTGEIQFVPRTHGKSTDDLLDDLAEITYSRGDLVVVLPTSQMPKGLAIAAIAKSSTSQIYESKVVPFLAYRRLAPEILQYDQHLKVPKLQRSAPL